MADSPSKRIPPLAWIIGAALVLIAVVMLSQWRTTYRSPTGRTMPGTGAETEVAIQPPYLPGPTPPPAPTGAGPTNQPGVLSGPKPDGQLGPS